MMCQAAVRQLKVFGDSFYFSRVEVDDVPKALIVYIMYDREYQS